MIKRLLHVFLLLCLFTQIFPAKRVLRHAFKFAYNAALAEETEANEDKEDTDADEDFKFLHPLQALLNEIYCKHQAANYLKNEDALIKYFLEIPVPPPLV